MIQAFKNIPLKYKLIVAFLLIITINAISGVISINLMKQLGELVNVTYDKALMSGTFAQASKFDFSQYDSEIKSALLAADMEEFETHRSRSEKAFQTLLDDLEVVKERALSDKTSSLIAELKILLEEIDRTKGKLISEKDSIIKTPKNIATSMALENSWTADKLKKKIYRKLTALYDDAAEVGYDFRLTSEEKNKKNLTRTIFIISSCLVAGLILSLGISYIVISPMVKLENVCKKVGEGNYSIRSEINSKDELGTLASSFNFMLSTIQEKDQNISTLLSSLPFGLFYFDENGNISKERSKSTDIIFKNFHQYNNLETFYSAFGQKTSHIKQILKAAFQGMIPFDSAVYLLSDTINFEENGNIITIHLSFKPKYGQKNKLERVIVFAEDVTEKNRALAESKKLTERVERISKVSTDIASFKEFIPAARNLYESCLQSLEKLSEVALPELKRDLHSLKGLLGIYSFTSCADDIHELEDFIQDYSVDKKDEAMIKMKNASSLFKMQSDDIINLLALSVDSGIKYVDINKLNIIKKIADQSNNQELLNAVGDLDRFPLSKVMSKYAKHSEATTAKLENKRVDILFEPSDEISYDEIQKLDTVLVHVLNNSIDHGIESVTHRKEIGKSEAGKIRIQFKRNKNRTLEFTISDDGKGIDGDYLYKKALSNGLITDELNDDEKINLIFKSGLSSKEETSDISGRGIGMDAVKHYLESIGGSIKVSSQQNIGTTFFIQLPGILQQEMKS